MMYPELAAWFGQDDSLPCLLFELNGNLDGSEQVFYFSTKPYVTGATESPANTAYYPVATWDGLTEKLQLNGGVSVSFGNLELDNTDGALDHLAEVIWANRKFTAFIGDVRWPRGEFKPIQVGYVESMDVRQRDALSFRLRDNLQALNYPVSEVKLPNEEDTIVPTLFGDVSNITPAFKDPANLVYKIHTGPVAEIAEVRDNGVPVSFNRNTSAGEFTLTQMPFGNITVSARGDSAGGYSDTVAGIVKRLISGFNPKYRLPDSEIDYTSLQEFEAEYPQCVGLYLENRTNILAAVDQLTKSVFATPFMSRLGKFSLIALKRPTGEPVFHIDMDNIVQGSFQVRDLLEVTPSVRIAYNRNYTVQESLVTGIPERHKQLWKEDWRYRTATNPDNVQLYKLFDEPDPVQTQLQIGTEAQAVAQSRVDLFGVQRRVYACEVQGAGAFLELGDTVSLKYNRYSLDTGVLAKVISCKPNWSKKTTAVELLV